uniref:Uncharacterized protein n=1 Tax=Romanomermis culicivorax TaxID=13658 RepID=A0A915IIH9_ROMCU
MLSMGRVLIFVCSICVITALNPLGPYCGTTRCPAGCLCSNNGQCLPEDAKRGCILQYDCPLHYTCISGRCRIYPNQYYKPSVYQTCSSTSECKEKYHMCRLGRCWKSALPDSICTSDFSCPNNDIYMCVSGMCKVPGDGKSYGSCLSKSNCPINHICENKRCYPIEQGGQTCTFDTDCPKSDLYQCAYLKCRLKPHLIGAVRRW